jgi:hypothetical protein
MYQEVIKSHQSHQDQPSKVSKVCVKYNMFHISIYLVHPYKAYVGILNGHVQANGME